MSKIIFLILFLISALSVHSQDVITKTTGEKVVCKITHTDSTRVYFTMDRNGRQVKTYLNKSTIADIQYKKNTSDLFTAPDLYNPPKNSLTIGILQGGGSLIGFDYEYLITDFIGIQAGAGIVGFGAGINAHFKRTIRSTYFSVQYWHQGIGSTYSQSLAGPCIVFRGKKWFTAQLGIGVAIEKGPSWPESMEQPPVMLTYSIGGYIPW